MMDDDKHLEAMIVPTAWTDRDDEAQAEADRMTGLAGVDKLD